MLKINTFYLLILFEYEINMRVIYVDLLYLELALGSIKAPWSGLVEVVQTDPLRINILDTIATPSDVSCTYS